MAKKIVDYLSASQIGTFLTCPIAYRNFYIAGIPKPPPNIYMAYGTSIHKALEVNFKAKKTSKKDMDVSIVYQSFLTSFQEEQKKVKGKISPTVRRSMELSAYDALKDYMLHVAPTIQPKEIELKFEVKLKNFPVTLMGYIDLITEDGYIIDYKTAGKDWKRKFSQKNVDNNLQLTIYSTIYRKLFKQKEKGLIFDVMPRCETKVFRKKTTRTDSQILTVLKLATNIEKVIELGVFTPNLQSCSQCYFRNKCDKCPIIEQ